MTAADVTVRRVEHSGPDLKAWHRVYAAAHVHDSPDEPVSLLEEVRAEACSDQDTLTVLTAAVDHASGQMVGVAACSVPQSDNQHVLVIDHLAVLPSRRRDGLGTRLLDDALALARTHARGTVILEVLATTDDEVAADQAARAWGFTLASADQRRVLALPPAADRLARARAHVGAHAEAYEVVRWAGDTPDPYVGDRAAILRRMSTDVPLGDLAWGEERWDPARVRRLDALVARSGRRSFTAGAVHRDTGQLVAATSVQAHPDQPGDVLQWDTLVLPEHRGHRLGLAVKIATLEMLRQHWPAGRRVITGNAAENAPMIAVNDLLGFVVAGAYREYQRDL